MVNRVLAVTPDQKAELVFLVFKAVEVDVVLAENLVHLLKDQMENKV